MSGRTESEAINGTLELFDNAVLWKHLLYNWTTDLLWHGSKDGYGVSVCGKHSGDGASASGGALYTAVVAGREDGQGHSRSRDGAVSQAGYIRRERVKER